MALTVDVSEIFTSRSTRLQKSNQNTTFLCTLKLTGSQLSLLHVTSSVGVFEAMSIILRCLEDSMACLGLGLEGQVLGADLQSVLEGSAVMSMRTQNGWHDCHPN